MGLFSSIGSFFKKAAPAIGGFLGGPVGGLIGSAVSGGASFLGNERTNSANSAQALRQMQFQERMSNTSYQRGMKDMKTAGLNPILAYSKGGASSPGGSQANMTNSAAAGMDAFNKTTASAVALRNSAEQIKNMSANTTSVGLQNEKTEILMKELRKNPNLALALEFGKLPGVVGQGLAGTYSGEALAERISELLEKFNPHPSKPRKPGKKPSLREGRNKTDRVPHKRKFTPNTDFQISP